MRARRLAWLGVRAENHAAMIAFLRDVLGLRVEFEERATAELSLPNDDRIQVFGPGHRYYDLFGRLAAGPVALFEVDDVGEARVELEQAGIEVIGALESDQSWTWLHFRAPDGNLYELASRHPG